MREDSIYKGQLKEKKLEKKATVKGQTLGLKMKDLVEEALKASGSPVSFCTVLLKYLTHQEYFVLRMIGVLFN